MAKPSFFDKVLGRGSYMEEFASRRKEIIHQARREKHQLRREMRREIEQEMRRNTKKYEEKLLRDDRELYQQFGIKQSQRANRSNLSKDEQVKARHKAWRNIQKQMREQKRDERRGIERKLHDIELKRDEQIKAMRDSLRAGIAQPSDPQQILNISEYQQSRQSPPGAQRRAA